MSCLAPFPAATVFGFDPPQAQSDPCAAVQVEVAARGAVVLPDEAVGTTLDLARARIGLGAASGPVWVRVRTDAARSADEDSYVGISGEAWVPVVAEAAAGGSVFGFRAEVGLVPDPWVSAGNRAWGLGARGRTAAEELEGTPATDAGVSLAWSGVADRLGAEATLTSGEGANRRERNEGKDIAGAVNVAPFGNAGLVISLYGRNGSRGLGYTRAHRAGLRIAGERPRLAYGAEVLQAWGVGDDALREPGAASLWLRARPVGPLLVAARADAWSEELMRSDALGWRALGAAGVALDVPGGSFSALAGADHLSLGPAVAPFAGTSSGASSTSLYLHVELRLDFSTEPS